MNKKIAVAMSIYKSDRLEFIKESIDSILNQEYKSFELFLEVDGPVSEKVESYLFELSNEKVHINFNAENSGLAKRLNNIIEKVLDVGGFSYVARMDADDISCPSRFTQQVNYLELNNAVDVVGTDVLEISELGHELFYKKMDSEHSIIEEKIIKRCPFNHPSVMFRIRVFELGFRYNSKLLNTQDYYLWVDLLSAGMKFGNINEPLLKFRIDNEFHSRRGLKKAINDFNSRVYAFKKLNVISLGNVTHTILLFFLRLSPSSVKKIAYRVLR